MPNFEELKKRQEDSELLDHPYIDHGKSTLADRILEKPKPYQSRRCKPLII